MNKTNLKDLERFREAAKTELERKLTQAYADFDIGKAFSVIEERLLKEATAITDALLGIDRKWSEIEIKDGKIRDYIKGLVDTCLAEKLGPKIEREIARQLELKTIEKAIDRKVKGLIESTIYNIDSSYNATGKKIDAIVNTEIERIFEEWTSNNTK